MADKTIGSVLYATDGSRIDYDTAANLDANFRDVSAEVREYAAGIDGAVSSAAESVVADAQAAADRAEAAAGEATTVRDGLEPRVVAVEDRQTALESAEGFGPSTPEDGQTASLILQPGTETRAAAEEIARRVAQAPATQHVSTDGDDAADGLTWGTAKKNVATALAALPFVGGVVLLGPGEHTVTTSAQVWNVDKTTVIQGQGRGITTVTTTLGDSGFILAGAHRCALRGMTIQTAEGTGASIFRTRGDATSTALTAEGATRTQWTGWTISDVHGIRVRPNFTAHGRPTGYGTPAFRDDATDVSDTPRVVGCEWEGHPADGAVLVAGGRSAIVSGNYCHDSGSSGTTGDAIKIMHGAEGWQVTGNVVARSTRDGIDTYNARGGIVSHNTIIDCGVNGIESKWRAVETPRADRQQIIGNRIVRCENGIHASVPEVLLVGNYTTSCRGYGIRVGGSVDSDGARTTVGGTITGNVSTDNGADGFVVPPETASLTITGNRSAGNGGYGYSIRGAHIVLGNSAENNGLGQSDAPGTAKWNYLAAGIGEAVSFMANIGSPYNGETRMRNGSSLYASTAAGYPARALTMTTSDILQIGNTGSGDPKTVQILTPTGGTITTRGNIVPFSKAENNTLGSTSIPFAETHTTVINLGGLWLRNNGGTLEKATSPTGPWTAV